MAPPLGRAQEWAGTAGWWPELGTNETPVASVFGVLLWGWVFRGIDVSQILETF